jgi:hypothetical protein
MVGKKATHGDVGFVLAIWRQAAPAEGSVSGVVSCASSLPRRFALHGFCRVRVRSPRSTFLFYGYVDEDPFQFLRLSFIF